uniref:RNA silencing suppressor n=1 Tax=Emaravirus tritici TaxID=1980428 RepID=A0A650E9J2_9VIRU|nr:RNA silencing suppressor [Emaravirus tritici]
MLSKSNIIFLSLLSLMFPSISNGMNYWNPFSYYYSYEQLNDLASFGNNVCEQAESDSDDDIETEVRYVNPYTGDHVLTDSNNYCHLHSAFNNQLQVLEINKKHNTHGKSNEKYPDQSNVSLPTGVSGYIFNELVDGFQFHLSKSPTRTHIVSRLVPMERYFRSIFILPDVSLNDFAYLQVWYVASDGLMTAEIGMKKWRGNNYWTPLVFNTDDEYSTGWFGDKHIEWPKSVKRTRDISTESHIYKNGDEIKLTTEFHNGLTEMWINGDYIGSVEMDYKVNRVEFGFEQDQYGKCREFLVKSMKQW